MKNLRSIFFKEENMKKGIFVRVISAFLLLALLSALLIACADDSKASENETSEQTAASEAPEEGGIPEDALPEELNFNRTFKILGNENRKLQYYNDGSTESNTIGMVIYERNMTVEERLGVELSWTFLAGEGNDIPNFINRIRATSEAGDAFDGVVAYNLVPQIVASEGLAANLYHTEYIDLSAPWWPGVYTREMIVNDQLYCLVESGSYGLLNHMMAMYFNNEMLESRHLQSPYELLTNNEWTVGKLKEMIKETYEDKDNDSKVSDGDIFGYCTGTKSKMDCWFFGLGNQFAKVQDDEVISLLDGDHIGKFVDTMVDFFEGDDAYHYDSTQFKMFKEKRAYFYCSSVMLSEQLAAVPDTTYDYGVVPMPKMDSSQERYYTHVANCHDTWCVPYNVKDMDCTSAVIECMASEALRQIDPYYFETYVKIRTAPDERLAGMYDLIRDSVTFDFTYLFSRVYSSMPGNLVKNCYLNPEKNQWSTVYAGKKLELDASFAEIVKTFENK